MQLTEFEQAIQANWPDEFPLSTGICPTCPDCQRAWDLTPRAFYLAYEAGEIFDEGGFSWQSCECCGSTFGGDRYPAHYVETDGKIGHIEICVDCLLYLANGDLPETWTQHPESVF